MADKISKEARSRNMAKIKGKDTSLEIRVRKYLFKEGFRYRKNDPRLPGKPDIVLPKYKTVVFVNGCFWHRHKGCKLATTPKTNTDFWNEKFTKNIKNDEKKQEQLMNLGWKVLIIWECELNRDFEGAMRTLIKNIRANSK